MIDGDPVATILLIFMVMLQLFWLSQTNTVINPIAGNTSIVGVGTCTGAANTCTGYAGAWTSTKWLLWIIGPFFLFVLVHSGFKLSRRERTPLGDGDEE